MLMHPGQKHLEMTLRQHLTWPGLTNDAKNHVSNCLLCKRHKSVTKNYSYLPLKTIEEEMPWNTLCMDLIGLYTITNSAGIDYKLWAMTFIEPVTGWFEIAETHTKTAEHIGKLLDRVWLCRYLRPLRCIYDNRNKFLSQDFQEMLDSYNIKDVPIMVKNP